MSTQTGEPRSGDHAVIGKLGAVLVTLPVERGQYVGGELSGLL